MENPSTEPVIDKRCERCGALIPAIQEWCVACLVSDLNLTAEEYFDPAPPFSGLLGGSAFTVLEEIGRGGMGVVYRARQGSPPRDVAIKVLQPHLVSSPDIRRRLFAEAAAMAELNHPGILPLYSSGEHDGQPWIAMKLATGGTLSSRRGQWAGQWRKTAELLAGLADAVQHAHERGLIHRDVKPGNVLFDENGKACLADFGLVKWIDKEASDTMSHAMLGTPAYLAPEVAHASAGAATTASDVYGLGAILYELMTGGPPFKGAATAELLRRIATEEPPAPRRLRPDIPGDLEIICQKALMREPAARYSSAAAFAADLRRWLAGKTIMARRFSALEKLWRLVRRNPLPSSLAAALAVALIAGVANWIQKLELQKSKLELEKKNIAEVRKARDDAEQRVDSISGKLPDLLAPIGRLDVLDEPFKNLDGYYRLVGSSQGSNGLIREAKYRMDWAHQVLRPLGKSVEATEQLNKAVSQGTAATEAGDAGADAWVTHCRALRLSGVHAAILANDDEAIRFIQTAVAVAEEGARRFPGDLALRVERQEAFIDQAYSCMERGDPEDIDLAGAILTRAPEEWQALAEATSAEPTLDLHIHARREQAACYLHKGVLSLKLNDFPSAIESFRMCHTRRVALASEFKDSAEDKRLLGVACCHMGSVLLRHRTEYDAPVPLSEIAPYLNQAEGISKELAGRDSANQRWQADWGLAAMHRGALERAGKNYTEACNFLDLAMERLKPVTAAAVPAIHEYRTNILYFQAGIYENKKIDKPDLALDCWTRALDSSFEHVKANPLRAQNHFRWVEILDHSVELRSRQPVEEREKYFRAWLSKLEAEVKKTGAPQWWQLELAVIHQRLADTYAADPNRMAAEADHSARARENGTRSLEFLFASIQADPLRGKNHYQWKGALMRTLDLWSRQPAKAGEEYLCGWLDKLKAEAERPGAPVWWQLNIAAIHRRLAEICDADPARIADAAVHNRQAFIARAELLLREPRVGDELIDDIENPARKLLKDTPSDLDRVLVAENLTQCAASAAKLRPVETWRASWATVICSAIFTLPGPQRSELACKAREAIFAPVPGHEWSPGELSRLYQLMDLESTTQKSP